MIVVRHAGIVVKDMEESVEFYKNLLGLAIVANVKEEGEFINTILGLDNYYVRTVKLADKNGVIVELLKFPLSSNPIKSLQSVGCSHIAFTVDNLSEMYDEFLEKGIKFNSSPQKSPDGKCLVAFCKDPNGVFIELVEVLS